MKSWNSLWVYATKKTGQILEIIPIELSNIQKVLPTPSIKIRIMEFQQDVLLIPYDIAPGVQSYSVFKYLQDSKRPENLSAKEYHIIPMTQKTLLHYK